MDTTASTSFAIERLAISISSQPELQMKRELAECHFLRPDRLISNGLRRGVTSTKVTSADVKNNENSRSLRSFRRRVPITAASNTDKSVVSDDDDSVSNITMNSSDNSKRKRIKISRTNSIAVSLSLPPLTPSPLKLKTSQIHSKKYPFPQKLFDLLKEASASEQSSEIVSWLPDEMTFVVHNHARFAAEFLPAYFGHTKFRSFDRQLHYWGFELVSPRTINNGSFGGKSWKHPFFQKDRRDLLKQVTRKAVGGSSTSQKAPSSKKKIKIMNKIKAMNESKNKNKSKNNIMTQNKSKSNIMNKDKKKSRCVIPTKGKTTSRIDNFHPKISALVTDGNTADAMSSNKNTSLHLEKTPKNASMELGLRPRMVSPVYGVPFSDTCSYNPVQDILVSALDIAELDHSSPKGNVADEFHSTVSVDIKDDILSLFPTELFKDDNKHEQESGTAESVDAKDIVPIPRQVLFVDSKTISRSGKASDFELCPKVEIFEGNSFHDIDLTLDIGITNVHTNVDTSMDIDFDMEITMDEANLFLNDDDDFLRF